MDTVKLGTANIRNFPDMRPGQVTMDARTIMRETTICGLQEIQPTEDTPVVREALGVHWDMAGGSHETPIVWERTRWRKLDHNVIPFDRPRLPRPENPRGAVTSVILRSVKRPWLPPFAVVNTHLVAGGFNAQRIRVVQERWAVEWGILQDETLRLWALGLTVFVVGDLNHHNPPQLRPRHRFEWLAPFGSPDHVGWLENTDSVTLGARSRARVPLNSDHDLVVISGPLRQADEP